MTGSDTENSSSSALLPALYKRPVILDSIRFGKKRLASATDFSFARDVNSVPITVVEFPLVQRHFPIVFTDEPIPMPMAVLGATAGRNDFVDAKGRWKSRCYIPAYIRRYPFLFLENAIGGGNVQYVLCIDEESSLVSDRKGERLYNEAGNPGPLVNRATQMCTAFQGHFNLTREFSAAVRDHGLWAPNEMATRIAPAGSAPLHGFNTIDEPRFKVLDGAILADWNRRGWLQLIYSHLLSLLNWRDLFDMAIEPKGPRRTG